MHNQLEKTMPTPLPASSYTDPAVFELDKRKVFYRTWQCVGHVSEVAEPGAFVTYKIVDENILVVRGSDAELRAFSMCADTAVIQSLKAVGDEKHSCVAITAGHMSSTDGFAPRLKLIPKS